MFVFFFFFNDTATTEIYTLSLHDALPISIDETYVTHGTYASEQTVACPMAINRSPFTFHSRRAIAATTLPPSLRRRVWSSRWDPTPRLIDLRAIFFSPGRAGGWSCRSARFL